MKWPDLTFPPINLWSYPKMNIDEEFPVTPIDKLIEECSELIQALCKLKRFGPNTYHPEEPQITNIDQVEKEIDDVLQTISKYLDYMVTFEKTISDNKVTENNLRSKLMDRFHF